MAEKFRIALEDKLLPVQAFFNAIPDRSFVDTLKAFRQGVGAGFNDTYCGFPEDDGFGDEPINGIEFAIKDEEIVISYDDFFRILDEVCKGFVKSNPHEADQVAILLREIREKLDSL